MQTELVGTRSHQFICLSEMTQIQAPEYQIQHQNARVRQKESYLGAAERGELPLHPVSAGRRDSRVNRAGLRESQGPRRAVRVGTSRGGTSVPGLTYLFHLDLLIVDFFKVEDLGGGFDHVTGGRRGGGGSSGGCRHDLLRSPGGPGRLPPGHSGGDPRPPASGPTFSLEPRRSVEGTGAAAAAESPLRLRCVFRCRPRPPDFRFRPDIGNRRRAVSSKEGRGEFCN